MALTSSIPYHQARSRLGGSGRYSTVKVQASFLGMLNALEKRENEIDQNGQDDDDAQGCHALIPGWA
jgi:hypothetical protein